MYEKIITAKRQIRKMKLSGSEINLNIFLSIDFISGFFLISSSSFFENITQMVCPVNIKIIARPSYLSEKLSFKIIYDYITLNIKVKADELERINISP
jgi:hypothetical protein